MPATQTDLYAVLGVSRDAAADAIKKAYRKLAVEFHPDRNKSSDAETRFKEVTEAYAVLSDPKKRVLYDSGDMESLAEFSPEDLFGGVDLDGLGGLDGSLFGSVFGGRKHRGDEVDFAQTRPIMLELHVSLERIMHGGIEQVGIPLPTNCSTCQGTGAKPGSPLKKCPTCDGQGHHATAQSRGDATIQQISVCRQCHGSGQVIDEPCRNCRGTGKSTHTQTVSVAIVPGVADGIVIRIQLPGGQNREAHVVVRTQPHPHFERRGHDLWSEQFVNVTDAVLGTKLNVVTLDGDCSLTVPERTRPGAVLRLRGQGLPIPGTTDRGHLYITISVRMPKELTPQVRDLYEQIRDLNSADQPQPA